MDKSATTLRQAFALLLEIFRESKYAYEQAYLNALPEDEARLPEVRAYASAVGSLLRLPKWSRWLAFRLRRRVERLQLEMQKAIVAAWRERQHA